MTVTAKVVKFRNDVRQIAVHNDEISNPEALLTFALVERWGMIMGTPDGEDSSGRQKVRIMTASELVERACRVTEQVFMACRDLGWIRPGPTAEEFFAEDLDHPKKK